MNKPNFVSIRRNTYDAQNIVFVSVSDEIEYLKTYDIMLAYDIANLWIERGNLKTYILDHIMYTDKYVLETLIRYYNSIVDTGKILLVISIRPADLIETDFDSLKSETVDFLVVPREMKTSLTTKDIVCTYYATYPHLKNGVKNMKTEIRMGSTVKGESDIV